jgi:SAM-dependent methyltransferase
MARSSAVKSALNSIREWLTRFPTLVAVKRAVWRAFYGSDSEIIGKLPLFEPWSPGPLPARANLTILAANQTFPFLAHYLSKIGKDNVAFIQAKDLCADEVSKRASDELKQLFNKYGSDKAATHDYHFIYGAILSQRLSITAVLEIGVGSNNEDVVSNMGSHGKPGASLRAFRDFLPNAQIYGADIDKRILFKDERILTFFVDQTNLESFDTLAENIGNSFDLIIDDGLHSPNANIAVLIFALNRLKLGGCLIVEDTKESALPLWKVVAALLPTEYRPRLIRAGGGAIVFAVERLA